MEAPPVMAPARREACFFAKFGHPYRAIGDHERVVTMKNLILVRHAKSSWDDPQLDDRERPLNRRGKRDAPLMGAVLKQRAVMPDLILSSPARRALRTAKLIAEQIEFPADRIRVDERLYLSGTEVLLNLIRELPDPSGRVFIVGHNPDFTRTANLLADAGIGNVPTCGIVSIEFAVDSWEAVSPGSGRLGFFDYPKRHQTHPE